jgi:S1-C subfamily serine protease
VARLADLQPRLIARLGILAVAIDDRVGELQPAPRLPNGILVTNVVLAAGGASQGAFQPGDIIHTINGRAPQTIDGLEQALAAVERGATVVLQIERAGRLSFVATPLF